MHLFIYLLFFLNITHIFNYYFKFLVSCVLPSWCFVFVFMTLFSLYYLPQLVERLLMIMHLFYHLYDVSWWSYIIHKIGVSMITLLILVSVVSAAFFLKQNYLSLQCSILIREYRLWSLCTDVAIYAVRDYCKCLLLLKTEHAKGTTEASLFYTLTLDVVVILLKPFHMTHIRASMQGFDYHMKVLQIAS